MVNFYPSISAELMEAAIEWARNFTHISDSEKKIIMESKKSLIFINGTPWVKKGGSEFDVAQGSYDGAEACELVGLYILSKLQDLNLEVGLKITIEANLKVINFLDICMDLDSDIFKPYIKPNTTPCTSTNRVTTHPAPLYTDALAKSGYDYKLEFNPEAATEKPNKRNRSRKITWFNPPFSQNVKTKVGEKFLSLIDRCFPPGHPLKKICNRNTLKLSYRCTPNIGTIISAKNSKLLQPPKEDKKMCNCKQSQNCPVNGKCLDSSVIYRATINEDNGKVNTYTGLTCNDFKTRWGAHKHSFNNIDANQTTLSSYLHELKRKKVNFDLKWDIMDHAKPFNPVTGICALCTREKFYIAFKPAWATLNKRSEMYSSCRHKIRMLLCEEKT